MTEPMDLEERWLRSLAARANVRPDLWGLLTSAHDTARLVGARDSRHAKPWAIERARSDLDDIQKQRYFGVGIVHKPHRLFSIGDVVIEAYGNGSGQRWAFTGYSTKIHAPVREHYLCYARYDNPWGPARRLYSTRRTPEWQMKERGKRLDMKPMVQHTDAGTVRFVLFTSELPDGMRSKSACDPTVRAYVLERLRAADVGLRVGTSTPDFSEAP